MSHFPIWHEGVEWRTTEALFQALRVSDEETREKIRAEMNPMAAKMLAKNYAHMRTVEVLSEDDLNLMRLCLQLKIQQHPRLGEELQRTGERAIIEDVTFRIQTLRDEKPGSALFWGAALQEDGTWKGLNWLGRLWMELREHTREPDLSDIGL